MADIMTSKIAKKLEKVVKGKVYCDKVSRYLFSTDASIYQIQPLMIVQPKDTEDVQAIVQFCLKHHLSIHPRGGGSGLGGQSLGEGVIIDFTKNMNKIIEFNEKDNYFVTEPGVRGGEVDELLERFNKDLPPVPSSWIYATIGGMVANNASGAYGMKYGDFDTWVEELEVVLFNGEIISTKSYAVESEEFKTLLGKRTEEARIYRDVYKLWKANENLIEEGYPKIKHNNTCL